MTASEGTCSTVGPKRDHSVQVTKLHLATVRTLMASIKDSSMNSLIDNIETCMTQTYSSMSFGQLHMLRQTMQRYLLGVSFKTRGQLNLRLDPSKPLLNPAQINASRCPSSFWRVFSPTQAVSFSQGQRARKSER